MYNFAHVVVMLKHILSQPDLASGSVKVMTGPGCGNTCLRSGNQAGREASDGDDHCAESQSFALGRAFAGSHEASGKFS